MKNCELLMKFYEEQNLLINIIDDLVVLENTKNPVYKTSNMGGKFNNIGYRLIKTTKCVKLCISEPNIFDFEYRVYYEFDSYYDECCNFYTNDDVCCINFGKVEDYNKIILLNDNTKKTINYPMSEEQYFQYLTLFDLSSEKLYNYFINIKKDNPCILFLRTHADSGFDKFNEFLNNSESTKQVQDNIGIISSLGKITREKIRF